MSALTNITSSGGGNGGDSDDSGGGRDDRNKTSQSPGAHSCLSGRKIFREIIVTKADLCLYLIDWNWDIS
jgi:hypothetical protein